MARDVDWLTPEEVAVAPYWPSCDLDPEDLEDGAALLSLLASSRVQCEAFAPAVADEDDIPENYRLAQAMQARALYRAGIAGSGDQIGGDGLTVTVFPMDWTVKALLRPKTGKPVIW